MSTHAGCRRHGSSTSNSGKWPGAPSAAVPIEPLPLLGSLEPANMALRATKAPEDCTHVDHGVGRAVRDCEMAAIHSCEVRAHEADYTKMADELLEIAGGFPVGKRTIGQDAHPA
jgi:hypothetical protein